ncbi:MAG: hypothetical protein ACFFEA_08110 [Candidatus Thorarchaeota archaeon]
MSNFYPISPLVGITNTSYAAQAGVMEEKWACRVVRGKKILAEKTIHQLDLESYVGVIYGHIRLEGLSRHAVAQCAGRLMQFSRKYQTAGVCPDYEVPDLVYDDGSSPVADSEETSEVQAESTSSIDDIAVTGVGAVPRLEPLNGVGLWQPAIVSYGVMIAELAAYGKGLPEGHLDTMFENAAKELVRMWSASGEGVDVLSSFGNMILSCTKEGQLPAAQVHHLKIETGRCELLAMARQIDPDGSKIPAGYPCAFHEKIAKKVSQLTGAKIEINTSSTGCIVQVALDLG